MELGGRKIGGCCGGSCNGVLRVGSTLVIVLKDSGGEEEFVFELGWILIGDEI